MICDYLGSSSSERPLLRREVVSLGPPRSGEVICCLAGFLGESHDSGLRLGLDARADNGISSGASRTIRGKSRDPLPFSRSGADNRRFLCRLCIPVQNRRLNLRIGCCFSMENQSPPQWLGHALSSSCSISPSE